MNGFGFIEFEDELDAREIVPGMLVPHFMMYLFINNLYSLPYVLAVPVPVRFNCH